MKLKMKILNLPKIIYSMTRKHRAVRKNYEELTRLVTKYLKGSDLKYLLEKLKKCYIFISGHLRRIAISYKHSL